MLRSVPGALHSIAPPTFRSPADVVFWVWSTPWVLYGDRAALLHLDDDNRLTCVAATPGRLSSVGPFSRDVVGVQALECETSAVIAIDIRRGFTAKSASETDVRRHRALHSHLASYGVALLDTVIVAPAACASVTGTLAARPQSSGLRTHVPERPHLPPDEDWTHASPRRPFSLWPLEDEPA